MSYQQLIYIYYLILTTKDVRLPINRLFLCNRDKNKIYILFCWNGYVRVVMECVFCGWGIEYIKSLNPNFPKTIALAVLAFDNTFLY